VHFSCHKGIACDRERRTGVFAKNTLLLVLSVSRQRGITLAEMERIAPVAGAIRSIGWGESPHPTFGAATAAWRLVPADFAGRVLSTERTSSASTPATRLIAPMRDVSTNPKRPSSDSGGDRAFPGADLVQHSCRPTSAPLRNRSKFF
jgi:hypothetical protein